MAVEYWLHITPETHVRTTDIEKKAFYVFGPLHRKGSARTLDEEREYQDRITNYEKWFYRFLRLEAYNDYKRRLIDESILKGFWLRDAGMEITYYIPVSPSWRPGKKEAMHLQPHQYKPDLDNLEKALFDTLRPHQDCSIWNTKDRSKLWINDTAGRIHVICHDVPAKEKKDHRQLKLPFRYTRTL